MSTEQTWQAETAAILAECMAAPQRVDTRRGPVEYAAFGEGPAVLALHGAMGGYDQSLILARAVGTSGYRFLAISRPGYLGTPLAAGRSAAAQGDLLADFLDALAIADAAVIAVSGGGPGALQFALRHTERCRGLVLISTVSGPIENRIPFSFKLMTLLARLPGFARLSQRNIERDLEKAAARSVPDPELRARTLADPHAGLLFRALLRSTADRMGKRMAGTWNDIDIARHTSYALERISVPVLIVHGTDDPAAPFSHAQRLLERVPGAELVALEGGRHAAIFTHHEQVRPRVARFLHGPAGLPARPRDPR